MTQQKDVLDNSNYRAVLDHGFVGIPQQEMTVTLEDGSKVTGTALSVMGSDAAVVQAARVSYGKGTKSVREDRGLIRYLMRHRHTSPFEMCNVKFHIKLPIFVMRQLVRHRTASLNEYSGRYSEMTDEFYIPNIEQILPQSTDNKQGRGGFLSIEDRAAAQSLITNASNHNYLVYKVLLGSDDQELERLGNVNREELALSSEFPGVARELARTVLPVNNYTELYWSQNLHNLFHLIKLRMDPHAQWEIQMIAQAMYDLVKPLFPACVEAFDDYVLGAANFSRTELELLKSLGVDLMLDVADPKLVQEKFGLSSREFDEMKAKFKK